MEDVLPYIGITPVYDDSESDRRELTVPSVSGKTRDDAISTLSDAGFDCIIKGDGDTVTDQVPNAGMRISARDVYKRQRLRRSAVRLRRMHARWSPRPRLS